MDIFDPGCADGHDEDQDEATNKYEDLTISIRKVVPVFLVQFGLLSFYIEDLNSPDSDTKDITKVKFTYWIIAVLFSLYGGDEQLGAEFSTDYWSKVLGFAKGEVLEIGDNQQAMEDFQRVGNQKVVWLNFMPVKLKFEWWIRFIMDLIINKGCRMLIMYTFPIMLCVEDPMDFVKDCTAVLFISTLDDIPDDPRSYDEILVKLKFKIYCMLKTKNHGEKPLLADDRQALTNLEIAYATEGADASKFDVFSQYDGTVWEEYLELSRETNKAKPVVEPGERKPQWYQQMLCRRRPQEP